MKVLNVDFINFINDKNTLKDLILGNLICQTLNENEIPMSTKTK